MTICPCCHHDTGPPDEYSPAVSFVVPGRPVAKQSCRFTMRGARYTDSEVKNYAALVRICAAEAMTAEGRTDPVTGPVAVEITAHLAIPESWSAKRRAAAVNGLILPTVKPDWENIGKNIGDAMEGVVYADDKQIVDARVRKLYGPNQHVAIAIKAVKA